MYSKRKSEYLDYEEDEWEKEASASSTSHQKQDKKSIPPNPYAVQIDILADQYKYLSDTELELAKQLEQLQLTLEEVEKDERLQKEKINDLKKQYSNTTKETIHLLGSTKKILDRPSAELNEDFMKKDNELSNQLESTIEQWKVFYREEEPSEESRKTINSIVYKFKRAEFEVMDLIAQIKGYEARIQSLDRSTSKLNGLPQLTHILNSDISTLHQLMKTTTQQLEQLEKQTIRPKLESLVQLKVILPLQKEQFRKKLIMLNDLISHMERIHRIALRQRACQQTVSFISQQNRSDSDVKAKSLHEINNRIENQILAVSPQYNGLNIEKDNKQSINEIHITMITNLLDEFYKNFSKKYNITSNIQSKSVIEKIYTLKRLEIELKAKWQSDIQSCLDAAQALCDLQKRLSDSLFTFSESKDNLIMTPNPYTSLQAELESRATQLETAISKLEEDSEDQDKLEVFEEQKKLFSLFFTDPYSFEQLYLKYL